MNQASSWTAIHIRRKKLFKWGVGILIPVYLFTPLALIQCMCLFLLFLLIGSRLYSEYLIRNIRVSRRDAELRVFRYEWVRVELQVENRGLLPAFMLVLSDAPGNLSVLKFRKTLCTLTRRSWTLMSWEGHCSDRGVSTLGPALVRGADPLGLFPFQLTAVETSRLYVYPVFRSITLNAPGGIPLGNMIRANPLYEDITRCRSLRPYNPGDEPRRINWKVSARTGEFMVNEYEATASYPLMIFLNVDKNEYPVKKQGVFIERAIEAAAALCLRAAQEKQELGIVFYTSAGDGGISVIAPSAFTLVPILERLAALNWTATANVTVTHGSAQAMLEQGKYLSYGTRFLYTGPDLGDEAYISLNSLKKYHLSLEYLIIDERAMPALVPGNSRRYKMKEEGREIV
ncbi:MAG: DUF58 domain-containing protein [Treponema sp.]|jgi:uncharacterized protein (DUF58 family)|nr:DUF58 domain-containing protein [Treponema sp.]